MTIESGIGDLLAADPAVAALVGARITPWPAPQGQVSPWVTWFVPPGGGQRVASLTGPSGLKNTVIEINCWSDTGPRREEGAAYAEAKAVAKAVRAALDGYQGLLGGLDAGVLQLDGPDDNFDIETRMVHVSQTYSVWHEEET